ncbi:hypothetical protein ACLBWT_18775 [Paenibacillus sp. D51F]
MNLTGTHLKDASAFKATPVERLRLITDQAIDIFMSQMASGRLKITSERSVQLQLGSILKTLGELMCVYSEELFVVDMEVPFTYSSLLAKSNTKKALIDIVIQIKNVIDSKKTVKCCIELKHFKKENHREPNNRYDAVADLKNLEAYIDTGHCNIGRFLLITDHLHYVQHKYSLDTADFNVSHGHTLRAGATLVYHTGKYGDPIALGRDHTFDWKKAGAYYYLLHDILP